MDGLSQVLGKNLIGGGKIRDRAADFEERVALGFQALGDIQFDEGLMGDVHGASVPSLLSDDPNLHPPQESFE